MKAVIPAIIGLILAAPTWATDVSRPSLAELKWVARPIVVFADSPNDPRVSQQLAAFEARADELEERDVILLVDTDPSDRSELRTTFRPRDFTVLVVGKDGEVKYRKPAPVSVKEVIRLIDRMPLRKQELEAQRRSAGQ